MGEGLTVSATIAGVKAFADLLGKLGPGVAKALGHSFRVVFEKFDLAFGPHLQATYDRCTKIKTLLNKDEPVSLLSQYVNLNFKCANKAFDDYSVIEEVQKRRKIIISGTAGGGKTIFMKYLWVSLFESPKGKIPIFIELRKLNDLSNDDLMLYVFHSIIDSRARLTRQQFDQLVTAGAFVFMFDGFDELLVEKRKQFEKQILAIANNNPDSIVIVSSRPDERFNSWQAFSNFSVQPLDKAQVVSLIEKLNYDDKEIKKKFIERVKRDLYVRHKSFLSSPLLATMMLITFRDFADIPEKIHLFYDQAFEALFAKHDATKEGFKRSLYTNIPSDDFKKYLSYFCLVSYYEEKYEFRDDDLKAAIQKGLRIDNVSIDIDNFIRDLLESICVMQRDGLQIVFSHRTFQEFFSAYALSRYSIKNVKKILTKISRRSSDSVIQMLFDMNPELVEGQFVVPMLKAMVDKIEGLGLKHTMADYLAIFSKDIAIQIQKDGSMHFFTSSGYDLDLARGAIWRLYPSHFERLRYGPKYREEDKKVGRRLYDAFANGATKRRSALHLRFPLVPNKASALGAEAKQFERTGLAHFFGEEKKALAGLLSKIEARRALRNETIDDVFGFGD